MPLSHIQSLAAHCASLELCLSPELAAAALSLPLADVRKALAEAAATGFYRRVLLPHKRTALVYQPTPKGAGLQVLPGAAARVPRFLRTGLLPSAAERAMLRGYVALVWHPDTCYLTIDQQAAVCGEYAVATRGYARALMSSDWHLYVPVLSSDHAIRVVTTAAERWLPALEPIESGPHRSICSLNFVTQAGHRADALRAAIEELRGPNLAADLATLDRRIAADRTGALVIRHAAERMALSEAATSTSGQPLWLGTVVEATC